MELEKAQLGSLELRRRFRVNGLPIAVIVVPPVGLAILFKASETPYVGDYR